RMKRASKYGAKPTTITHKGKEVRCASKLEAKKLAELVLLEKAGAINNLEFHPVYKLSVAGKPICKYVADASFFEMPGHRAVVLEVKGYETEAWKLKAKMFRAMYPTSELRVVKA
ncbi:MAG TPA: DUF1064 domain-containing protein, partial [Salinarimonas sp.]|nr:DUF1064 domain-containing protein [Salinarimonas sp.]